MMQYLNQNAGGLLVILAAVLGTPLLFLVARLAKLLARVIDNTYDLALRGILSDNDMMQMINDARARQEAKVDVVVVPAPRDGEAV